MGPVFALDKLYVWLLCKATVLQLIISPFLLHDGATVRKPWLSNTGKWSQGSWWLLAASSIRAWTQVWDVIWLPVTFGCRFSCLLNCLGGNSKPWLCYVGSIPAQHLLLASAPQQTAPWLWYPPTPQFLMCFSQIDGSMHPLLTSNNVNSFLAIVDVFMFKVRLRTEPISAKIELLLN